MISVRKDKKTVTGRGSSSMTRGEDYELMLHLNEGSCDEEEEYQPISKREEEEAEAPDPENEYDTPTTTCTSLDVISRNSSPSDFVNTSNTNVANNGQGNPTS